MSKQDVYQIYQVKFRVDLWPRFFLTNKDGDFIIETEYALNITFLFFSFAEEDREDNIVFEEKQVDVCPVLWNSWRITRIDFRTRISISKSIPIENRHLDQKLFPFKKPVMK